MTDTDITPSPERMRTAPAERFAGEAHSFDLSRALRDLRAEPHPARDGHRQVTIFHHTPVTHVLFAFDAGGTLGRHSTGGLVTIHALEGRLLVHADGVPHQLAAGELLILRPDVPHDVRAEEPSAMLLTVHLLPDATGK
jgi:quercetin dioxygenase-like cupin family protein